VAGRFALSQSGALHLEGAFLTAYWAQPPAAGAGLLRAQRLGLLVEEGLQGALGEPLGRGVGDLLHGAEIDVEPRAVVAEGAAGDDLAPLGGQAAEFVEFLGGEGAACHDASSLGVATRVTEKVPQSRYEHTLDAAKLFMTSVIRAGREIDYGWFFLDGKRRENYDDWWRCEIRFDPALDEAFGITHTKQQIHPKDYLTEVLAPDLENVAKALNGRVRLRSADQTAEVERLASERDQLLAPLPTGRTPPQWRRSSRTSRSVTPISGRRSSAAICSTSSPV
jgi:hypothetical protein